MKKTNRLLFLLLMVTLVTFSCKRETITTPQEADKSIDGSWKIVKAIRNGTDLTSRFDFSHFRIQFKDSSYVVDSLVPFVVQSSGTYHVDDPKYPFKIIFHEKGAAPKTLNMEFPITGGVRNIILNFSPGCAANSYQYTLQKSN